MHFNSPPNSAEIYWETPKKGPIATKDTVTLSDLRKTFKLELDVCAAGDFNACCKEYFTPEQDGLKQEWTKNFFLNPPGYSEEQITPWLKKAVLQASKYHLTGVALLPSYTGAPWFHEYCLGIGAIRFLQGRVKFWKDGEPTTGMSPNFYSMIMVWSFEK